MLAGELLASKTLKDLGHGRKLLVRDLQAAHRFDLDEKFARAADELRTSNPSSFHRGMAACRVPYSVCWFETAHAYRDGFAVHGDRHEGQRNDVHRVGVLLKAKDNTLLRWNAYLAWNFKDNLVNVSPLAKTVDFTETPETGGPFGRELPPADEYRKIYGEKNLKIVLELESRFAPIISDYHRDALRAHEPSFVRRLMADAVNDWGGELFYWIATLALLNSRNVATTSEVDNDGLNRARRRRGKPPLLSFTTCQIAPRFQRHFATAGETPSEASVRAHFVRGHFKMRKSGAFWWSPHLRGDQRLGFVDKDYRVEGEAKA